MLNKKLRNNLAKFSKSTLAFLITINMVFPTSLFAAQVQLNGRMNLRYPGVDNSNDPLMKSYGVLPKGTVLEIPDEFVILTNGKMDVNATINNWIQKQTLGVSRFQNGNSIDNDYFFPIKVVSVPPGADRTLVGHNGSVALRALARRGKVGLVTTDNTPLVRTPSTRTLTPSVYANTDSNLDTVAGVCIGNCATESDFMKKLRDILKDKTAEVARRTNQLDKNKRIGGNFDAIAENFRKSCYDADFNKFKEYVKQEAPKQNIPPEVMMSIMTQESAGLCEAMGDKNRPHKSVGPFQLSVGTVRHIDVCTAKQKQALHGKDFEQMATDKSLECLQNPAISLKYGMKVFLDKYKLVNNGQKPSATAWSTAGSDEKDNFRKALAAYNGGEGWVKLALADIAYARKHFDITLKDDWETMRLFMFRHKLESNGRVENTGRGRKLEYEFSNVAYVDAVLGRGNGQYSQVGFSDHWQVALNPPADYRYTYSLAPREI